MSLFNKKLKKTTKPEWEVKLESEEKNESLNIKDSEHVDYLLIANSTLFDVAYYEKQTSHIAA